MPGVLAACVASFLSAATPISPSALAAQAANREVFTIDQVLTNSYPEWFAKRPVWSGYDVIKDREKEQVRVSYTLGHAGRVRLRVVSSFDNECIYRELVHWEVREAGSHTEVWDWRDTSNNLVGDFFNILYSWEPLELATTPEQTAAINDHPLHPYGHIHTLHPKDKCGQLQLTALPILDGPLTGIHTIKVVLHGRYRGFIPTWGTGVELYVDSKPAMEGCIVPRAPASGWLERRKTAGESIPVHSVTPRVSDFTPPEQVALTQAGIELDSSPAPILFLVTIDARMLENGAHRLQFMCCDHNDHVGAASLDVEVRR